MSLKIRPVTELDLKSVYEIGLAGLKHPWSEASLQSEWLQKNPYSTVAVGEAGDILGYLFIRSVGSDFEITSVCVIQKSHRQGIGKALLLHFLNQLSAQGHVFLEVSEQNQGAVAFYQSLGFMTQATRKNYYPDGASALCMKLNLANP